ncbi:MAG: hypothetical protein NWE92_13730 [Candidatus Bathyarchaeota archaeon]|nr:hypothetical protein [Candidatus Bathyarchaeota archaeon]
MPDFVWNKPVLSIFKERDTNPEVEPFVVVKARKVYVTQEGATISGTVQDFFRLMGDVDYLSSPEGSKDHYVVCWFDDTIPDMNGDLRRLHNVVFTKVTREIGENSKRTYNAAFTAKFGRLK